MCGIVGIVGTSPVNQRLYDALTVLQHRGQDAAGIVTVERRRAVHAQGQRPGARRVPAAPHARARGNVGIGHVRYPTAGCDSASAEAQPFYVNAPYGICLAHNGNLTNAAELAEVLIREDRRHLNTTSDSEVLLNVFASELQRVGTARVTPADVFAALNAVYRRCRGGYAVVAMIIGHGILGFRDPNGIRPLVLGRARHAEGRRVDARLRERGARRARLQVRARRRPRRGGVHRRAAAACTRSSACRAVRHTPCIFEYVYFARPDSIIDNISVYRARMRMGDKLAEKILREHPDHDIDVVIPIPDTSRTSALQLAQKLGLKYREGFIKNRYIGRTFIMPGQEQREKSVRRKLNAHRPGVPRQERAAGGRLHRARHDLGADHRPRARGGRQEGVFRLRGAAGALPERVRHRHAGRERAGGRGPQRGRGGAESSAPTGSSTRTSRTWSPPAGTTMRRSRSSTPPASPASTSPATSRPSISRACSASAPMPPRRAARAAGLAQSGRALVLSPVMRLLMIEHDARYRALVRHHLSCRWPDAKLVVASPVAHGSLAPEFLAQGFDAVLLGERLAGRPRPRVGAGPGRAAAASRRSFSWPSGATMPRRGKRSPLGAHRGDRPHARSITSGCSRRSAPRRPSSARARDWRSSVEASRRRNSTACTSAAIAVSAGSPAASVSELFLAESEEAGALVVMKLARDLQKDNELDQSFQRFLQEYEIVARIRHPQHRALHDLGVSDEHAYLAMEYFRRGRPARRMRAGVTPRDALRYAISIARALEAIHAAGALHRDLKPGNVLLREDGTLALIDFGLAKDAALGAADHRSRHDLRHAALHEPGAGARRADR